MDADFSHDPADIPRLLGRRGGADLVIGSRYVDGGRRADWGAVAARDQPRRQRLRAARPGRRGPRPDRRLQGVRREVLEAIDLESIASLGYAFQVETTYRAVQAGFRVEEVPIMFRDRRVGSRR